MLAVVDTYTILKTFHVLFAIVWVGGGIAFNIFATRAVRAGDGHVIANFAKEAEFVGQRVFFPSSLLVLVFGILTVLKGHIGFTTLWVVLGLAGIGFTIITGSTFLGPQSKRVGELIDERGGADPEVKRRLGRLLAVGRIDQLVLLLVVADMVLKPGA